MDMWSGDMTGTIWCKEYTKGNNMLKKVVADYGQMRITPNYYNNSIKIGNFVEFENGDNWKVVKATDSNRGVRSNIAYIDRSIDMETVKCIIHPTLTSMPFSAYRLYGEGDLHLTDEIPLPF